MLFNCSWQVYGGGWVAKYVCINGHEWADDGSVFVHGVRLTVSENLRRWNIGNDWI